MLYTMVILKCEPCSLPLLIPGGGEGTMNSCASFCLSVWSPIRVPPRQGDGEGRRIGLTVRLRSYLIDSHRWMGFDHHKGSIDLPVTLSIDVYPHLSPLLPGEMISFTKPPFSPSS